MPAESVVVESGLVTDCPECGTSKRVTRLRSKKAGKAGSCATCGNGGLAGSGHCDGGGCAPGTTPCPEYNRDSIMGRLFGGLYECLCCPDPCYEPKWVAVADSAFFLDAARPITQQRFRWGRLNGMIFPDRSEFFWPRADGNGKGPRPTAPFLGEPNLTYDELNMYTEAATGPAGAFVEMNFRSIRPDIAPQAVGFADMTIGSKALLFDCELLQLTFQFKTYLPSGAFIKGLGTGHVSLEPSLLFNVKLADDCYLQGQIAEWIPLGGDPAFSGAILHYHGSVNAVLHRPTDNVLWVGNIEFGAWHFQDGLYTDPSIATPQRSSGEAYLTLGPGLRLFVCDKLDAGLGMMFSLTDRGWAEQLFHTDFRWRF